MGTKPVVTAPIVRAGVAIIAVGIGDLPGVRGIGVLEIALGVAAAGLTVAALGGRGRTGTSG